MVRYESIDPSKTVGEVTIYLLLILTIFGFAFHPIVGGLFLVALIISLAAYFHFSIFHTITAWLADYLGAMIDYWRD